MAASNSSNIAREEPVAPSPSIAWAGSALVLTAIVGAVSKVFGVLVAPGMRGIASQRAMDITEIISATLSYTFAALLVALICGGSFELARARKIGVTARGSVVAISGLVVALASPAVVQRLHTMAALALAVVASIIAIIASTATIRVAQTRAVGAVLGMFALSGVLRPIAWEVTSLAGERASLGLYYTGRGLATFAVVVQALAVLLAAAWLGTRSRFRGRLLANAAIVGAFVITYFAARDGGDTPSALEAVLHGSLSQAAGVPLPYGLTSIAAFLVPATILLALVAVVQRAIPPAVLAALALALLSHGAFDVPLHALAVTAAAQWAMLAMVDDRSMWAAMVRAERTTPRAPPPSRPAASEAGPG
ncbi:MAG: hypothetical protein QOI41_7542 [Myxococcales bacterium]|jgi:hypothetical protein|nr:hypothetical protein [Myxococcales bacterium]